MLLLLLLFSMSLVSFVGTSGGEREAGGVLQEMVSIASAMILFTQMLSHASRCLRYVEKKTATNF